MRTKVLRDETLVAAIGPPLARFRAYLDDAAQALAAGWDARGGRRALVLAATRHAVDFQTWRSLARDGGVSREAAVGLASAMVHRAAWSAPIWLSAVSFAEIGVKAATGRLAVPDDLYAHVIGTGVRVLGLSAEHGLAVSGLPLHHRDPFDRLLIAQARQEGLTLVTADPRIHAYDVAVLDPLT